MEDVDGDGGQKFRRLVFLSNKNVVQSEARLITGELFFKQVLTKWRNTLTEVITTVNENKGLNHHWLIRTCL